MEVIHFFHHVDGVNVNIYSKGLPISFPYPLANTCLGVFPLCYGKLVILYGIDFCLSK